MTGVLIINKDKGMTSHDVVSKIRKILGEKRVGHPGTLDPNATGVLPILVGTATKTSDYFLEVGKAYRATAKFGYTSDTQDIWGVVEKHGGVSPNTLTSEKVIEALKNFQGDILQIPPMYSALKRDGVPLYKLARRGEAISVEARPVTIYESKLLDFRKEADGVYADIEVHCGRGTYIRTIINDLGEDLGCGAVMSALERISYGQYGIDESVTLDELRKLKEEGCLLKAFKPTDGVFIGRPSITLSEKEFTHYLQGKNVVVSKNRVNNIDVIPDNNVKLYVNEEFFATCEILPQENEKVLLKTERFFGRE